jgi:uncharacterized surface protein with fasciclin (FAS1) repeats
VKFRKAAAAVSLVTAGLLLAACSSNSSSSTTTGPPTTAATASKSIVQIAASNPEFSTLVAAIKAAGLTDTLSGPGPYTVFAPTNAAFAALPAGTLTTLLEPQNKPELVKILTYHVVTGALMAKDIKPGTVSTAEDRQDRHRGLERRHPRHRRGTPAGHLSPPTVQPPEGSTRVPPGVVGTRRAVPSIRRR